MHVLCPRETTHQPHKGVSLREKHTLKYEVEYLWSHTNHLLKWHKEAMNETDPTDVVHPDEPQ